MIAPLLAMPPPEILLLSSIGVVLVLLIAGLFVTATRTPGKRSEQNRRAGLGLVAIVSGPLVAPSSPAWATLWVMYTQPTSDTPTPRSPSLAVSPASSEGSLSA